MARKVKQSDLVVALEQFTHCFFDLRFRNAIVRAGRGQQLHTKVDATVTVPFQDCLDTISVADATMQARNRVVEVNSNHKSLSHIASLSRLFANGADCCHN